MIKDGLLSIGRMAELNHTSVPTLRLYDKMGLLIPSYTDPETNYRYYDIKQNARFDMIQYMKEMGMSLSEIKEVLDSGDLELIEDILIRKREQMFAQLRHLKMQRDAVSRFISGIERYRKSPSSGTTSLEYIDRRLIYAIPADINFYDYSLDTYEQTLAKLKDNLISNQLPQVYYYNVGTSLLREDFLAQRFVANDIFVFVDDNFPAKSRVKKLDSGMYACIYLDNYDDEKAYARKLLDFCRGNDYEISGDYICEVLTEFNIFDSNHRSMFLRLQVPVSFKKP